MKQVQMTFNSVQFIQLPSRHLQSLGSEPTVDMTRHELSSFSECIVGFLCVVEPVFPAILDTDMLHASQLHNLPQ